MIENKRSNWAWLITRGIEERLTTARRKKKRKKSWEGGLKRSENGRERDPKRRRREGETNKKEKAKLNRKLKKEGERVCRCDHLCYSLYRDRDHTAIIYFPFSFDHVPRPEFSTLFFLLLLFLA
jgi:hypothetical protein